MIYVVWGDRHYGISPNGDIYDERGKLEIIPEGLKKAIKEAGINEEANSNR